MNLRTNDPIKDHEYAQAVIKQATANFCSIIIACVAIGFIGGMVVIQHYPWLIEAALALWITGTVLSLGVQIYCESWPASRRLRQAERRLPPSHPLHRS